MRILGSPEGLKKEKDTLGPSNPEKSSKSIARCQWSSFWKVFAMMRKTQQIEPVPKT